jgi:ferric-dicitrate binding protein FerR (iron transport regulator)
VYAGEMVQTATGVVATFALEGGGEIRQNGDSVLRWTEPRHVSLDRGQVYVDSGGRAAPLTVHTIAGTVRDIGTRFEVLVRDGQLRVRVRDGAVRLDSPSGHHEAGAGRELVTGPGRPIVERPIETFGADWAWIVQGTMFRLEGATLARFLEWVEAEGGRTVEFRVPRVADEVAATVLHGSIRGLSVEAALEATLPAAGLRHRVEGERVIIERVTEGGGR